MWTSTAPGNLRISAAMLARHGRSCRSCPGRGSARRSAAGRPKFRIWVTMSAGWKKNSTPGNASRQLSRSCVDVVGGRAMALLQGDQDFRVERADGAGIAVGQVDAAIGQADVVERWSPVRPAGMIWRRIPVDLVGEPRGLLDAHAGGGAHVQADRPASTPGKKSCPRTSSRPQRGEAEARGSQRRTRGAASSSTLSRTT